MTLVGVELLLVGKVEVLIVVSVGILLDGEELD